MKGINQVQVNPKAGLTFASALRSILRSDPDVVLIGEIRDHETAPDRHRSVAHRPPRALDPSTPTTRRARSPVSSRWDIEPFLVGSALDSVVAQRLARKLCDRCRQPYDPSQAELDAFNGGQQAQYQIFKAAGCTYCSNTGYRGRLAVHEVMAVTEEIERLAVGRASSSEIARVAMSQGMLTLRQDGWMKVQMGLTSIEEILRVVA